MWKLLLQNRGVLIVFQFLFNLVWHFETFPPNTKQSTLITECLALLLHILNLLGSNLGADTEKSDCDILHSSLVPLGKLCDSTNNLATNAPINILSNFDS
jgi:hypothetical protein